MWILNEKISITRFEAWNMKLVRQQTRSCDYTNLEHVEYYWSPHPATCCKWYSWGTSPCWTWHVTIGITNTVLENEYISHVFLIHISDIHNYTSITSGTIQACAWSLTMVITELLSSQLSGQVFGNGLLDYKHDGKNPDDAHVWKSAD